jgi:hypothetical protein
VHGPALPLALPEPARGAPPAAPRVVTVFLACAVVLILLVVVPGVVTLLLALLRDGPALLATPARMRAALEATAFSFPGLTAVITVNGLALAAVALAAAALSPERLVARLALGAPRRGAGGVALAVLGTLGLSLALDAAVDLCGLGQVGFLARFRAVVLALPPGRVVALTLVIGLVPGLCEELFFRGYVQTRLVARFGAPRAVVAAGLLFGAVHLDPVQSPLAAALGVYLGLVALRAGSIWPAVAAHAANNMIAVLTAALIAGTPGRPVNALLCAGGTAVAAAVLYWLRRR